MTKLSIYKATCVDTDCPIRAQDNCDPEKYAFPGNYDDTITNAMKANFACTYRNLCLDQSDNTCHVDADCMMTGDGTYSCNCKTGFTGNGVSCTNDNECVSTNNCDANADCTDTSGSYVCNCRSGYVGDGISCANVNECDLNYDNCHANAVCNDNLGSFSCSCNTGYVGDGVTCDRGSYVMVLNTETASESMIINKNGSYQSASVNFGSYTGTLGGSTYTTFQNTLYIFGGTPSTQVSKNKINLD